MEEGGGSNKKKTEKRIPNNLEVLSDVEEWL